ncbi:E3 ubiquitin-protein ligase hrd1 [Elasticomyces elasticus]|nr:E3 ubiquitin-protein ligase hrd1 [Elasticomyces elasticus]
MPSFRDDVGGWLLAMFFSLIASKVWAWMAEGRVDVLEQQPPASPRLFHARLSASLALSVCFTAYMLNFCVRNVMENARPGMMVIFTFEFAILQIFTIFTTLRYLLSLQEARVVRNQMKAMIEERRAEIRSQREQAAQQTVGADASEGGTPPTNLPQEEDVDENEIDVPGWEDKRRWLFALELATDLVKLTVYIGFFTILMVFNGFPMHIMRDVYLTCASFSKKIRDFVNYRKATQDMNTRYTDATAEELGHDSTCIVCRETMVPWGQGHAAPVIADAVPQPVRRTDEGLRAKKLPCGHILHLRCLKAWLERQQVCPTCRRPVLPPAVPAERPAHANGVANAAQLLVPGGRPLVAQNPANPNQPIQPQARVRTWNLGPVRIALANGPAEQVQNALHQIDVPNRALPTATGRRPALGSNAPTQIQLMQIEERLVREAQNLNLEQAQLATIRVFEGELARLRASYAHAGPASAGSSTHAQNIQAQVTAAFARNAPVHAQQNANHLNTNSMGFGVPQALPGYAFPQAYQPHHLHDPRITGQPVVPQGMIIPPGWTLMPLQRIGSSIQTSEAASVPPDSQFNGFPPHVMEHLPAEQCQPNDSLSQTTPPPNSSDDSTSAAIPAVQAAVPSASHNSTFTQQCHDTFVGPPTSTEAASSGSAQPPWSIPNWDFNGESQSSSAQQQQDQSSVGEAAEVQQASTAAQLTSEPRANLPSKGKGRAVQVEDVHDGDG